jgi:hypothetical protein
MPGTTLSTLLLPSTNDATGTSAVVFFNSNTQTFSYSSNYNDYQLNYRMQSRPGKDAMALQPNGMWVQHAVAGQVSSVYGGLRLSTLDESVVYSAARTVAMPTPPAPTDQNARYHVSTNNDMFGVHFGGDITQVHDDWSWGIRAGSGALLNFVDRLSVLESNVAARDAQKLTDERLSWLLEAGIHSKYQVRPNLALRAGYDFIYYANVAIAADNLGFLNGFPELISDAPVFFHGGSVGLEATW